MCGVLPRVAFTPKNEHVPRRSAAEHVGVVCGSVGDISGCGVVIYTARGWTRHGRVCVMYSVDLHPCGTCTGGWLVRASDLRCVSRLPDQQFVSGCY